MMKLVNYNKGATVVSLRNTQVMSVLYTFLAPALFHLIDKYLLNMPEYITNFIAVMLVTIGLVMFIISTLSFLVAVLPSNSLYSKPKGDK